MNSILFEPDDSGNKPSLEAQLTRARQIADELAEQCLRQEQLFLAEQSLAAKKHADSLAAQEKACQTVISSLRQQLAESTARPEIETELCCGGNEFTRCDSFSVEWDGSRASVQLTLPENAASVQLFPGKAPCIIQNLSFPDSWKLIQLSKGMTLSPSDFVFPENGPGLRFSVRSGTAGTAGLSFCYAPISVSQTGGLRRRVQGLILDISRTVREKLSSLVCKVFRKRGPQQDGQCNV